MAARGTERMTSLVRMLNLLPYFEAHPNRSIMEAAADLGQRPQDIMDDLNRLWCCGLPGLLPGDLVELEHSYSNVQVQNAQGMDRPLRLTHTEAGALLLALEDLEQQPGLSDPTAVQSAAAKLRAIMGNKVSAVVDAIANSTASPHSALIESASTLDVVRLSVDKQQKLGFHYISVSADTPSDRIISVARVFTTSDGTYVTGWDDSRGGHRTFRASRMSQAQLIDAPAAPHSAELKFDADDPFALVSSGTLVKVRIHRDYQWLAEYVPITLTEWIDDEWRSAHIPVSSTEWLVRFVLQNAGGVIVISPIHLAEAVAQRAMEALEAYDGRIGD